MSSRTATGFIIAIASTLAACASTTPTVNPGNRYQLVGQRNGENYYCQKQAHTGSRANSNVSCIDQQMFEAYSKVGQDPLIQGPRSGGPLAGGSQ
jgi:hypothetical protein